jgi:hypothetical protein
MQTRARAPSRNHVLFGHEEAGALFIQLQRLPELNSVANFQFLNEINNAVFPFDHQI